MSDQGSEKKGKPMSEAVKQQCIRVTNHNTYIPDDALDDALKAMSEAYSIYPDGLVSAPMIDWFDHDAQDAMDMGALQEPKFDGYSDIAIMQKEWYVQEVLKNPFIAALRVLHELGLLVATPSKAQPKPTPS